MNNETTPSPSALRSALSSPFRLELLGLFGEDDVLSVSDMAARTGRPATSLYHHLKVLEDAEILRVVGTRPKGKRFETVYSVSTSRLELEVEPGDEAARAQIAQTVTAAFRMAARDFIAALDRDDLKQEGADRNLFSMHLHARVPPEFLARFNERLDALADLFSEFSTEGLESGPDDQFLSFTFALAPLRGRRANPIPAESGDQ